MTNTHPSNIKRKSGRPPGRKDKRKRRRRERIIPPAEVTWFDKRQAAGHLGLSVSTIEKRFGHCFVSIGDRRLAHRDRLDAEALKFEPQQGVAR
jgi:hypothetical protein